MTSSDVPDPMTGEERTRYLALALLPGIGTERLRSLLAACGSAGGAFSAPFAFLKAIAGIGPACASAITKASDEEALRVERAAAAIGAAVLLPGDADYPESLLELEDRPAALFALGDRRLLHRPAVAIVGSREHSRYGGQVTGMIATQAAAAGLVVVSGMARGLDAIAHEGALQGGGTTIGVLGNGHGVVYPAANRRLYEAVMAHGLLVTEFPPGERPNAGSFPRRNRIISGLARATCVVEAAAGSGALITARMALEQNRDVFAVPGPITSTVSVGTNLLIREGAFPLLEMSDLLCRYPELTARGVLEERPDRSIPPAQARVLALLRGGPRQVDELARHIGLSGGELLALLGGMEIAGLVRQEAGMHFAVVNPGFAAARPGTV
jgi:DNA processing protein